MNLIEKISNLGFFSREIVFTDESIFTKECRKNGARKSNLIKSCVASLFTNTTDLTPPIVIAEGIFGFIAQKYLESYALSAYWFKSNTLNFLMEILNYFDNVVFINLTFVLIATHLLCLVCFGVFLAADKNFDYPILLNSFN